MNALILRNQTALIAQFIAKKGQVLLGPLPGIAPHAELRVPTDDLYAVIASTIIDGKTYSTAPATITGPMEFSARVKQLVPPGIYEIDMQIRPSPRADELRFQTTTAGPVTFTISKNGIPLQRIHVKDPFRIETLTVDLRYSVYAVINGVTTETVQTTNPSAVITAIVDNTLPEPGYFKLTVA